MADRDAWKNFKTQMKTKRAGKKSNNSGVRILEEESIIVQRLSADVSGKAQKYTRIGAREFVPFEYEEVTVENIKRACQKNFDVGESMTCDVVAGEQGPSCSSIKQIPDLKVVHVRFIEGGININESVAEDNGDDTCRGKKRKRPELPGPSSNPTQSTNKVSTFVPRSMSLVEMLKLGKDLTETTTGIHIYEFDLEQLAWTRTPYTVDFNIAKDPIGTGGFRKAYKASSRAREFKGTSWVVKKYIQEAISDIEITGQTVEQHTKKVVQMHCLARHFAAQLEKELSKKKTKFGAVLKYNKIFFGKCGDECVTIEEFIPGSFSKHINNTGEICGNKESEICQKSECLAHFSYERSNKELMVLDIQGCDYSLFDPEIATKELISDGEFLFCTGNLSSNALNNFCNNQTCNDYCKFLELAPCT